MNFKNILIAALFTTSALHGVLDVRTLPVPKSTLIGAAAGATALAVGTYGYKKLSAWWFISSQDYAAQTCALEHDTIQNDVVYNVTADPKNGKKPITIEVQPKRDARHPLRQYIGKDVVIANTFTQDSSDNADKSNVPAPIAATTAPTQPATTLSLADRATLVAHTIASVTKKAAIKSMRVCRSAYDLSQQGLSASLQGLQVTGTTLLKNHMTWAGIASIALNVYLLRNKTVPTAVKSLNLAASMLFVGNYFKEKFKDQLKQKIRKSIIIEAIKIIMEDARTAKVTDTSTFTYTFSINEDNKYYIARQQQAVLKHDTLPKAQYAFGQQHSRMAPGLRWNEGQQPYENIGQTLMAPSDFQVPLTGA